MGKKKTLIISSTIGLFLVLISLIGITYGYYVAKITGTGGSLSASAAQLNLNFSSGWNSSNPGTITASNIFPGWRKTLYFTVSNPSTSTTPVNYYLTFSNISNTIGSDFIYTLICRVNTQSSNGTLCKDISNVSFPTTNGRIFEDPISIPVNTTHYWSLILEYKNQNYNQFNGSASKSIYGKINVESAMHTQET